MGNYSSGEGINLCSTVIVRLMEMFEKDDATMLYDSELTLTRTTSPSRPTAVENR